MAAAHSLRLSREGRSKLAGLAWPSFTGTSRDCRAKPSPFCLKLPNSTRSAPAFFAQLAGSGHVDAAAAGGQQAAGLVHGDDGQTALLHLRTDDLRHIPGRIGHLRAGSDLEGQHQHRVSRSLQRGGSPQAGQQGETEQAQPITQMFFHTESPLSVPDYDSWWRPARGCG